jgi:hypothetical protein
VKQKEQSGQEVERGEKGGEEADKVLGLVEVVRGREG